MYIHTAEPQERLRKALEAGGRCVNSPPISLTCTPLRQKGTEMEGVEDGPGNLNFRTGQNSKTMDILGELRL